MKRLMWALVFVGLAMPANAQEQRASVEGTVRDGSGAVLPGVLEARSPAMAGVQTTVTDARRLPFSGAAAGTLRGDGDAAGISAGEVLGHPARARPGPEGRFDVGGRRRAESVEVSGESPLIDVKQNAAGANVQAEIIERIPKGRDFADVVTSAPGITNESRNRGIQIDGASGADNRFMIDGVDTTNLLNGTSGKGLPPISSSTCR